MAQIDATAIAPKPLSSFQYDAQPRPDHEDFCFDQQPLHFDDSVLAGFRQGYREHASSTAEKTLSATASATGTILQIAGWIQEMRSRLNRKEFGTFVKELLQWVGDEARKYLDIARTFKDFDLSRLQKLEPFTLLKLRSKRYLPVVERLQEELDITPKRVQELISELIPKQSRRKRAEKEHNDRQEYADGVLERHADAEDGTFYYTLKEVKLSDHVGSWLEAKLESQTIGQILASVVLAPQSDRVLSQLEELHDVVEHARSLDAQNRKLEYELQKCDLRIAELEAKLEYKTGQSDAMEIPLPSSAPRVKPDDVQEDGDPHSFELEIEDEVAIATRELNESLEEEAAAIAPEQVTGYELEAIEAIEYWEPKQTSSRFFPAGEDDCSLEPQEETKQVEPAREPQVFQVGDQVEIVSSRQGAEFFEQIGVVKLAKWVGCVVEVLGKTLWFCSDELVLILAVL